MNNLDNPKRWTAFIIVSKIRTQKKLVKILKPLIERFEHYNFNYYYNEIGKDHLSIRVYGDGKKELSEELDRLSEKYPISWYKQMYNADERKAYELGTRCAFVYMNMKRYLHREGFLTCKFLIESIHGFFDNIGLNDKQEGKLHLKMAWHFLVKKPFYLKMRKLKKKIFCRKNF